MLRDKMWFWALTLVLIVSLAACGAEPTAAPESVEQPTLPSAAGEAPAMEPAPVEVEEPSSAEVAPAPEEGGQARFQLLDYNLYLDSRLGLMIVGIIENTGDASSQPEPEPLRLVDASGNTVAEVPFDTLQMIAPGEKVPLVGIIYEHQGIPENWQDLEVRMGEEGYPTDLLFREFVRLEPQGTASRVFDAQTEGEPAIYGVSGWIANNAGSPAESLSIYVAGYDAGGNVTNVARIYGPTEYLGPGSSVPFMATLSMVEPIGSYELFAEGEVVEPRNLAEVEIADYTVTGPDEQGRIELVGEVVNTGSAPAVEIEIVMALVTGQREVLNIDSTVGSAIGLAPGERLPFKFSSALRPELQALWERTEFVVQGFTGDSLSERYTGVYTDLELEGLDTLEEEYGRYRLTGEIKNIGQLKAEVDVVAALYDAEGKVLDCASPYVGSLEPGGSQALDLSFSVAEGEKVASFKVFYGGLLTKY